MGKLRNVAAGLAGLALSLGGAFLPAAHAGKPDEVPCTGFSEFYSSVSKGTPACFSTAGKTSKMIQDEMLTSGFIQYTYGILAGDSKSTVAILYNAERSEAIVAAKDPGKTNYGSILDLKNVNLDSRGLDPQWLPRGFPQGGEAGCPNLGYSRLPPGQDIRYDGGCDSVERVRDRLAAKRMRPILVGLTESGVAVSVYFNGVSPNKSGDVMGLVLEYGGGTAVPRMGMASARIVNHATSQGFTYNLEGTQKVGLR